MNNKRFLWIALAAVFTFSLAACSFVSKNISNAQELKAYLASQPKNNSDEPIKVSMKVNEQMISEIAAVLMSTDKYVKLNISDSYLRAIPDYAFYNREAEKGCDKLISITMPKSLVTIGEGAFLDCNGLKITIPENDIRIGNTVYLTQKKGLIFGTATVSGNTMTVKTTKSGFFTLTKSGGGSSSNPFIGTWVSDRLRMTYNDTTWSTAGLEPMSGSINYNLTQNNIRYGKTVDLTQKNGVIFGTATVSENAMTVKTTAAGFFTLKESGGGDDSNPFIGTWSDDDLIMTNNDTTWSAEGKPKSGKYYNFPPGTWTVK